MASFTNQNRNSSSWTNSVRSIVSGFLLKEDGFYLLKEDSGKIILDQSGWDLQVRN